MIKITQWFWQKLPHEHKYKIDLGDPCYCGSDNCYKCKCGKEKHD